MIWGLIDWWNLNFKFAKTPFDLELLVGSSTWTPILTAHGVPHVVERYSAGDTRANETTSFNDQTERHC